MVISHLIPFFFLLCEDATVAATDVDVINDARHPLSFVCLDSERPARARANARLEGPTRRPPQQMRKKQKEISPTGFDPVTCGLPIQLFNHYGPTTLPLSYGDRVSLATRETREEARKFCQNPAEQQT